MRQVLLTACLVACVGCTKSTPTTTTPPTTTQPPVVNPPIETPKTKPMSKDDLVKAVRGKTIAQLKELFGKPDETELPEQFARPGVVNLIAKKWVYIGKFIDPDSEKPYRVVKVWIDYEDKAYNVEIP